MPVPLDKGYVGFGNESYRHFWDMGICRQKIKTFRFSFNVVILNRALTNEEANKSTEKCKHPKRGRKRRDKIKQATKECTNVERNFASKLVRDRTHSDATNEMTGKDNRG